MINKAIEKLEDLKDGICILPYELIEEEINKTINDLKSIEKVNEKLSPFYRIINKRIWGE